MLDEKNYPSWAKKQMLRKYLVRVLKGRGITHGMFAQMLNKKPSEISKWLTTDQNFTIDTLFMIEDALGITLVNISGPALPTINQFPKITVTTKNEIRDKRVALQDLVTGKPAPSKGILRFTIKCSKK